MGSSGSAEVSSVSGEILERVRGSTKKKLLRIYDKSICRILKNAKKHIMVISLFAIS